MFVYSYIMDKEYLLTLPQIFINYHIYSNKHLGALQF